MIVLVIVKSLSFTTPWYFFTKINCFVRNDVKKLNVPVIALCNIIISLYETRFVLADRNGEILKGHSSKI